MGTIPNHITQQAHTVALKNLCVDANLCLMCYSELRRHNFLFLFFSFGSARTSSMSSPKTFFSDTRLMHGPLPTDNPDALGRHEGDTWWSDGE